MSVTSPIKSATAPKGRSRAAGSKVTVPSSEVVASPQVPAQRVPRAPKVKLADLLALNAPAAKDAPDLARRCNVADDLTFRRAVTHHAQGSRVLAAYRSKLIKPDDSKVYVEKHGKAKAQAA